MAKGKQRTIRLSVLDEINIKTILKAHPYLNDNMTAAIALAVYELAAKITVARDYSPEPIIPDGSKDDE
jgi:hypothetical protein